MFLTRKEKSKLQIQTDPRVSRIDLVEYPLLMILLHASFGQWLFYSAETFKAFPSLRAWEIGYKGGFCEAEARKCIALLVQAKQAQK